MNMMNYSYNLKIKSFKALNLLSQYFRNKKFCLDYFCLNLKNLDEIKAFHAFLSDASDELNSEDIEIRSNFEIFKDLDFELFSIFRKNLSYEEIIKLSEFIYSISQENKESDLIEMIEKIAEFYRIEHYIADL